MLSSVPVVFIPAALIALSVAALAAFRTLQRQAKALRELREVIDALPAAIIAFDAQERCTLWNAHFANHPVIGPLLHPGMEFEVLARASIAQEIYLGADAQTVEQRIATRIARFRSPGEPFDLRDGELWLRVMECRAASGSTISVVSDLTDLKHKANALAVARDEAEAAHRAKNEFLANISHELRTPLNGVLGVTRILLESELTPSQRELLKLVDNSATVLESLVCDVIEASALGTSTPDAEAFSLDGLVEAAAATPRLQAQQKGLALNVELAPDASGLVQGQAVRLRRVLLNLLNNAVKYTERGEIRLRVARADDDLDQVVFEVRDTGVGFDPGQMDRLFRRFEQADGSLTRRFGGLGLGLSTCRDLVEQMGGEIAAQGRPGEGASFWVLLPLPKAMAGSTPTVQEGLEIASVAATDSAPSPVSDPTAGEWDDDERPLHLLCAEDHPVNRQVIEHIVRGAGMELTCVEDGRQAVEAFKLQSFDAVLMDLQMPVMDGLSATRAIRAFESASGYHATPIIVVTAHGLPEHVKASRAAGADRHITKPLNAQALLHGIGAALQARDGMGRQAIPA